MQPEDSSLVRRSPFSIHHPLPPLTFLSLKSFIGLGLASAASSFDRYSHCPGEILLLAALFVVPARQDMGRDTEGTVRQVLLETWF